MNRRMRRQGVVGLLAGLLAVGCVGCGEVSPLSDAWSRKQIDLPSAFADPAKYGGKEWPYLNAVDRTKELCGAAVPCLQAVRSDYATVWKFDRLADAKEFAVARGKDAAQIDYLVVTFDGTKATGAAERKEIIHSLSNINASSDD